ncbi:pirin family protein [Paenibacillus sp. HJGM_3]|uniref:pirin family protein n=1 Tax=Paenibacillus sp. HJGM_3 TaxID=3379816 RepID=UPI00385B4B40
MQTRIYTPSMQAVGAFDGGKIKEQKPIGFPREGSVVKRVGPLFYWAWATASEDAMIGLHPHQGFEIMTYVVEGKAAHGDTLGTKSEVGAGGVQVMQTGSGVSHQEQVAAQSELFQIWFEPYLDEAVRRQPTYRQHEPDSFPVQELPGVRVKTVIGAGAPIELVAEARMWDVEMGAGANYTHPIAAGHTLTALAIRGHGTWAKSDEGGDPKPFEHKDFILGAVDADSEVVLRTTGGETLRLILIEVPTTVDYPLYRR